MDANPPGRSEGERLAASELDRVGGEPVDASTNDHLHWAYDAAVIARLVDIDVAVPPIFGQLSRALDRFAGYAERFGRVLGRVRDGEMDCFTSPTIDWYHSVWFEHHENLLATLGIERGKETS
jgi:hypothetical protein